MSLLDTASLVITPNGYKEGKLYSVVPSDGSGDLNVTRATTATRVNEAGLVELVPYNLVTYSEQFNNADWIGNNITVSANSIISPSGVQDADTITSTSTTESGLYRILSISGTNTWSLYAKKGTGKYLCINTNAPIISAKFDLENGQVVGTPSGGATASIQDAGNGWYRCIVTSATSTNRFTIFITNNTTADDFTSSAGLSCYIWGAQLNEGSTAKDYQKTETRLNIPRLDYTNGTCPSILVEPQRTNLVTYSEQFDNASWNKVNDITVDSNASVAPDGNTTADRLNAITTVSVLRQLINVTAGQTYTFSGYIKKSSGSPTTKIRIEEQTAPYNNTNIDVVSTGTWQKFSLTRTIASGITQVSIDIFPDINSNGSVFIWGAQLEAGSYATSYIPTTSASVTRNADVISKTGISSLIGQTEGTLFFEIANIANDGGVKAISLSNGTINQTIEFAYYGNNEYNFIVRNGGTTYNFPSSLTDVTQMTKFAFAYKQNDFALYINGTQVNTSLSGNVPSSMDRLQFDWANGGYGFYGNANTLSLWKTRLTNTQLAQLTTI